MESLLTKLGLLTTSSAADVAVSGGVIKITGFNPIRKRDLLDAVIYLQQDEVLQVVTIGGTTDPTITADTVYIIQAGNVGNKIEGDQGSLKKYKHRTPVTLSGNAATDRQNVYDALASQINDDASANITAAAGTGGTAMTITDDAGYYKTQRRGASEIRLVPDSLGNGFVHATHFELTTAAQYAFGVGADLLAQAPILDPTTGNVTSSDQIYRGEDLANAVSGQDYDAFYFSSLVRANTQTGIDAAVYKIKRQMVFVDNGAGAVTTNAAGYAAMLKEVERVVYEKYENDPSGMINFFENPGVSGSALGAGAATGATGDENVYINAQGTLNYHILGAGQTILAPVYTATGLQLDLDAADNEGAEYSASVLAGAVGSHIVGSGPASFRVEFSIADVSDTDDCAIGFRKKEAYQANIDDYDEMAALNVITGNINSETILNNAATVSTGLASAWADGETHSLEVRIDEAGAVTYLIDDAVPALAPAFSFDDAEEVIPFFYVLNAAASAPTVIVSKWLSTADTVERRFSL